jgi:hypothetical protein
MNTLLAPKCPRCSGIELKLVSEKHRRGNDPRSQPVTTLSVYRCSCGTGFTHMVKHEPVPLATKG